MIATIPTTESNPKGTIIGYQNLLTASTTADAEKALVPNTYERWRPSSGAVTVKFQMAAPTEIDFIGIAAHNLSGESFVLSTAATIGGATTDIEGFSPSDNKAIITTFEPRVVQEIIFTSTLINDSEIGAVYAGKFLQMERSVYGGHSPMNLSEEIELQSIMSESGQSLGSNAIRKGLPGNFSWQFLSPSWYREKFQSFADSAKLGKPFFIQWRPDLYSSEVAFAHLTGSGIKPVNMGGGLDKMSVSITIKGHVDV